MIVDRVLLSSVTTPNKHHRLVIAPSHRIGDFYSHAVDCPFAFHLDGRQGMTVVGWDGVGYQTGLCWLQEDGAWTAPELIFARDTTSPYRTYNAALTSILRDNDLFGSGELIAIDGWYYGTYHAYPEAGYEAGPGIVGVARSRDLRHWEEYGQVIHPEDGGDWEQGGLYKSWLLEDGGTFWIFYNAKNQRSGKWIEQTGAVTSTDLRTWTRVSADPLLERGAPGDFDALFASDPCVLRVGDEWAMFYFGLDDSRPGVDSFDTGVARDGVAFSDDLRSWTKSGHVLVDIGPPGSIDDKHAHKPAMIWRSGKLHHYYTAVKNIDPIDLDGYRQTEMRGIGLATS